MVSATLQLDTQKLVFQKRQENSHPRAKIATWRPLSKAKHALQGGDVISEQWSEMQKGMLSKYNTKHT